MDLHLGRYVLVSRLYKFQFIDMTFNNIDFTTLGIIPQFINGILDMPQRKGDTFYDWGDEIEPLVSADDIYFGSRDIVLDAFLMSEKAPGNMQVILWKGLPPLKHL